MFVSKEVSDAHKKFLMQRGDEFDSKNPFSKILRGELETEIVDENPYAVVIKNNVPRTSTYNLVLPVYPAKDVIDFASNAPKEYVLGYQMAIEKAVQEIYAEYHSKKSHLYSSCARVIFNIGPYSQNSVPYLHAHVMGDKDLVGARQLTLSQKRSDELKAWCCDQSIDKVEEKVLLDEIEKTREVQNQDAEKIRLLKDGQVLGWKESSYLDKYSQRGRKGYWADFVCFLYACGIVGRKAEDEQGKWGGRAVIDVYSDGYIIAHAAGGCVLQKLPLIPLTRKQLAEHYQNNRS